MSQDGRSASRSAQRISRRGVLTLISAGILAISGISWVSATSITEQVQHEEVFAGLTARPANDSGTNILLVGSDDRTGLTKKERRKLHVGQDDYGRQTDTIMILHVSDDGGMDLVSLPRDTLVDIPAHTDAQGRSTPASRQKLNAAYAIGGPGLVVRTVENVTGVRMDHYAEIDFAGFVNVVDALGGVPICLPNAIQDEKAGLDISAGEHTLNGTDALKYVRARYFDPTADVGRMKRQQGFMGAVFSKILSPAVLLNPARILEFGHAAAASITTDPELNRSEIWNLAARARATTPSDIALYSMPIDREFMDPQAGAVVTWDPAKSEEIFSVLRTGERLDRKTGKVDEVTVEIPPSQISVRPYNGTSTAGLGGELSEALSAAGFSIAGPALNASTPVDALTIDYDPRYNESLKTLQAAMPQAKTRAVEGLGRTFRVIAGPADNTVRTVKVRATSDSGDPDRPRTAADNPCADR